VAVFPNEELNDQEFYAYGEALYRLGNYDKLIALASAPSRRMNPQALTYLALCYFNIGDFDKSIEVFRSSSIDEKFKREGSWAYGYSLYKKGRYYQADKILSGGESFLSHWDSLYYFRSICQAETGDTLKAIRTLERGLSRHSNSLSLLSMAAVLAFSVGDLDKSLEYSKRIEKQLPEQLENRKRLAIIYMRQNKPETAAVLFKRVNIERDLDALLLLAEAQLASSRPEEAITTCSKALKINRKLPKSYLFLSQAYEKAGRFDESQKYFYKYSRLVKK
jgi:tetratricopeptide (TPR) repeat protein